MVKLDEISKSFDGILIQCSGDCDEFHHIQPSLAAFVLGHERLRDAEPVGDGLLGEAGPQPLLPEELDHAGMFGCAECLAHAPDPERGRHRAISG